MIVLSIIYFNWVISIYAKNYADKFGEKLIEKRAKSIEKFMKRIFIYLDMKNDEIFYKKKTNLNLKKRKRWIIKYLHTILEEISEH